MNTADSSSNWKVDRRTRDIEIRHRTEVKGKTGVFARRDLARGYQITGAKHPIFTAPDNPKTPLRIFIPSAKRRESTVTR